MCACQFNYRLESPPVEMQISDDYFYFLVALAMKLPDKKGFS